MLYDVGKTFCDAENGYQFERHVVDWIGNFPWFGLKTGKGFMRHTAHPHPKLVEEYPPGNRLSMIYMIVKSLLTAKILGKLVPVT